MILLPGKLADILNVIMYKHIFYPENVRAIYRKLHHRYFVLVHNNVYMLMCFENVLLKEMTCLSLAENKFLFLGEGRGS